MISIELGRGIRTTGADDRVAAGRLRRTGTVAGVLLASLIGVLPGVAAAQQLGGMSQSRIGASASAPPATVEAAAPSTPPTTQAAAEVKDRGQSAAATLRRVERDTYEEPGLPYQKYSGGPSVRVAVDWCLRWGSECGQPAADKYCQWVKKSKDWRAAEFEKQPDVRMSFVMGTRDVCEWSPTQQCDGFKRILCAKVAQP